LKIGSKSLTIVTKTALNVEDRVRIVNVCHENGTKCWR